MDDYVLDPAYASINNSGEPLDSDRNVLPTHFKYVEKYVNGHIQYYKVVSALNTSV